jgi:peptide chain release factor subunit 1
MKQTSELYKLKLREMLKQVGRTAESADLEAVRRYIEFSYDGSGRGLVLFSHQVEDVWYAFPLAVPVDSKVRVSHKPFISPLVELNGLYGRYAVAIVDRQGGRFFLFKMGKLVAEEDVEGEVVRHRRKGRGSSIFGMRGGAGFSGRKEAEVVQRNLKEVANVLGEFCTQQHPKQVLLAGSDRTLAQFQDLIPSKLKSLVSGTFSSDMDATELQIRDLSFELIQELGIQRHKELVNTIRTSAAKGVNGVVGLDSTLSIANEGRVQVLITLRDYHAQGFRCGGCGYLTTQQLEKCLFCGGQFEEIPDAVEAVITQVIEKGGSVEVIDEALMGQIRIGALLRY